MNIANQTPQTNYDYFKQLWQESAPATRRKWRIFLALLGILWLGGAIMAYTDVAGIMRLGSGARILTALVMGPFGLLWGFLKWTGTNDALSDPSPRRFCVTLPMRNAAETASAAAEVPR